MSHELDLFLKDSSQALETELKRCMPVSSLKGAEELNEAIHHALFPGGKRMRPILTLLAMHTAGGPWRDALPVACAVEYLHTCSLILDDLPCMDSALERRGKKPTHLVFGESTAILAAVALLNGTWALLFQNDFSPEGVARTQRLLQEASRCIGPDGIIAGQFFDLSFFISHTTTTESLLKTASTTRFMLSSGAIMAGAPERAVEALAIFGQELGSTYQMLDDVIDRETDARLGPTGQFVLLFDHACDCINQATDRLSRFFNDDSASLMLEYTRRIFQPMIESARKCLRSETADTQTS